MTKRKQVTWRVADQSWLEQVQANPVGGSGAAHLYVFYVSWRVWEAHLYGFYVSGRLRALCEAHLYVFYVSGRLIVRSLLVLEAPGGSFVRVLRVLEALGGSFVRVLCVREVPGRHRFRGPMSASGSAKEGHHAYGGRAGCLT